MTVSFEVNGQKFVALNGGPNYTFNEAISFQVLCADQDEVDALLERTLRGRRRRPLRLAQGPLRRLVADRADAPCRRSSATRPPGARSVRWQAMLEMKKIEIDELAPRRGGPQRPAAGRRHAPPAARPRLNPRRRRRGVVLPEAELVSVRVRARREPAHARDGHRRVRLAAELVHTGGPGVDVLHAEVGARARLPGSMFVIAPPVCRRSASCGTPTGRETTGTPSRRASSRTRGFSPVSSAGISMCTI